MLASFPTFSPINQPTLPLGPATSLLSMVPLGEGCIFFSGLLSVIHQQGPGVSRVGSLCEPAGLCPPWEPLTGAEVTRAARDTSAFLGCLPHKGTSQDANAKLFVCLFGIFFFEHLHPWGMKWGLENLLQLVFRACEYEQKRELTLILVKKNNNILKHPFFWGKHKGVFKNVWIKSFIAFSGMYEYLYHSEGRQTSYGLEGRMLACLSPRLQKTCR